ncbi:hypothetical protein B0H10DRAFT_2048593 [Mycena sp. CBHHK59/15]|nr:hypothetical protein B0H10DRAFT_2048593 [Mycena sp. CBHHK59/15]
MALGRPLHAVFIFLLVPSIFRLTPPHLATVAIVIFSLRVHAALSVDPVPPLQWLNITTLIKGTTQPPGLKDAAIGYDEMSRSVIIFGGEASSAVVQGQTYLLNLETLTWSIPSPPPTLTRTPPARTSAVYGCDFAASNRNGFVVIGGKGADGSALADVWEYDFNNQFWSEMHISPGGPSARWGASGGIDIRTAAVSDPVLPGPNNTFWLWGGSDGQSALTDLWRLNVSGTLSSNLPNDSVGSWQHLPLDDLPGKVGQGSTVISQQITSSGGCNSTAISGDSCAQQASFVIDAGSASGATEMAALNCPAPRLSPTLIPNGNQFSTSFSSQVLLLLGTFNTTLWEDGGGLDKGEVAVLNTNTRSWTRLLPSGDPGTSGEPSFPSPREGSVAVMSPLALVGESRSTSSDIIVFGGRNALGSYLPEVWVLRAYNDIVTPSNPKWSGFGNGQLETGINASGTGVITQFISSCASAIAQNHSVTSSSPASTSPSPSSNGGGGGGGSSNNTSSPLSLSTSVLHKSFAPVSIALLLPSLLLFRFTSPSFNSPQDRAWPQVWYFVSGLLGLVGYGLGIGGIVTSFTTIKSIADDTHPPVLSTTHGRAGIALFACLYGLIPLLFILCKSTRPARDPTIYEKDNSRKRADSDATEKDRLPQSTHSPSPPASPRPRTHSWGPSSWRKSRDDYLSSDNDSESAELGESSNPAPVHRGFEVMNRPARTRRASGSRVGVPIEHISQHAGSHSLGDLDWLSRRRSLSAVGELDHSIAQTAAPPSSTPGTLLDPAVQHVALTMPPLTAIFLRLLLHASVLGFCIFCLVALWSKAPRSTFGIFLVWTLGFYVILVASAWNGKADRSTLPLLLGRLRTERLPHAPPRPSVSDTLPAVEENIPFPYLHHRPPYRTAFSDTTGLQSGDTDEDDDDRAEDEMRRRDISIVTSYPKRALRITNPS